MTRKLSDLYSIAHADSNSLNQFTFKMIANHSEYDTEYNELNLSREKFFVVQQELDLDDDVLEYLFGDEEEITKEEYLHKINNFDSTTYPPEQIYSVSAFLSVHIFLNFFIGSWFLIVMPQWVIDYNSDYDFRIFMYGTGVLYILKNSFYYYYRDSPEWTIKLYCVACLLTVFTLIVSPYKYGFFVIIAFFMIYPANIPFNLAKQQCIPTALMDIASKYYGLYIFTANILSGFAPIFYTSYGINNYLYITAIILFLIVSMCFSTTYFLKKYNKSNPIKVQNYDSYENKDDGLNAKDKDDLTKEFNNVEFNNNKDKENYKEIDINYENQEIFVKNEQLKSSLEKLKYYFLSLMTTVVNDEMIELTFDLDYIKTEFHAYYIDISNVLTGIWISKFVSISESSSLKMSYSASMQLLANEVEICIPKLFSLDKLNTLFIRHYTPTLLLFAGMQSLMICYEILLNYIVPNLFISERGFSSYDYGVFYLNCVILMIIANLALNTLFEWLALYSVAFRKPFIFIVYIVTLAVSILLLTIDNLALMYIGYVSARIFIAKLSVEAMNLVYETLDKSYATYLTSIADLVSALMYAILISITSSTSNLNLYYIYYILIVILIITLLILMYFLLQDYQTFKNTILTRQQNILESNKQTSKRYKEIKQINETSLYQLSLQYEYSLFCKYIGN